MNDEIKEILDIFTKYKDDWYSVEYILKPKQCVALYDYITNLKQENEKLKTKMKEQSLLLIDYQDMEQKYEDYKSRVEKAVEYMIDFIFEPLSAQEDRKLIMFNENLRKFENILNGRSDE